MPIGIQEVVAPVNYDKKKSRKKYAPRRVGWAPEMRLWEKTNQQLHYPVPAVKDLAQLNAAMQNVAGLA